MEYFFRDLHGRPTPAASMPRFCDFVDEMLAVLQDSPESFWKCRRGVVSLGQSEAVLAYIEHELLRGLEIPHYSPLLTLLECDRFSLAVRPRFRCQAAATVRTAVSHRILYVLHGSGQLHRFEQPEPHPLDTLDPACKILRKGTLVVTRGDVAEFRAATDCYDLTTSDFLACLEMRSAPLYDFEWHYDTGTLSPKCVLSTSAKHMRAELAVLTARHLGSTDFVACTQLKTMEGREAEHGFDPADSNR